MSRAVRIDRAMQAKYSFVRADLETSQRQIEALWAQGLGGLVDRAAREKYEHVYLGNPLGRGTCVLLVENSSGRPVGVQGFVPRSFWLGRRKVEAAVMADFVVVPEHRSLGPALSLMRTGIQFGADRFAFFYGTPNEKSLAIVRRAGLATVGMLTRYTRVVRSHGYWRRRIPAWLVKPMAILADTAIAGADLAHIWTSGNAFSWSEQSEFGPEIDQIWDRRPQDRVLGERSRLMLAWRYRESSGGGGHPWRLSIARDRAGLPIGYVVWRWRNGAAMVSDFLFAEGDRSLRTFMRSFAWHARQFRVELVSLEFFGGQGVVDALLGAGFASRERSPIAYVEPVAGSVAVSPSTAYMTSFDRDHEE